MGEVEKIYCPECGSIKIIHDYETHEEVCGDCGLVLSQQSIYHGPPLTWDRETGKRIENHGPPLSYLFPDKDLHTQIDFSNKNLSRRMRSDIYRLRKWQKTIKNLSERKSISFSLALNFINHLADLLNFSREDAENISIIFRKVAGKNINGRAYKHIAAGCVYYWGKQKRLSRELEEEICEKSDIDRKSLRKAYRFVKEKIGNYGNINSSQKELEKSIDIILNKLYQPIPNNSSHKKIREACLNVAKTLKELKIYQSRSPAIIAGSIIYLVLKLMGENRTQEEIAKITKSTQVSIRNNYKELVKNLYFEITI